jgi:hypothetical protein
MGRRFPSCERADLGASSRAMADRGMSQAVAEASVTAGDALNCARAVH